VDLVGVRRAKRGADLEGFGLVAVCPEVVAEGCAGEGEGEAVVRAAASASGHVFGGAAARFSRDGITMGRLEKVHSFIKMSNWGSSGSAVRLGLTTCC
jgi:hypothetical protein